MDLSIEMLEAWHAWTPRAECLWSRRLATMYQSGDEQVVIRRGLICGRSPPSSMLDSATTRST